MDYDVIVVGSGAAGSFAVKGLTERGLAVLLLEAGPPITPADFPENLAGPKEKGIQLWARAKAAVTGQPIQSRVAFYGKQQRHLFVKDSEHPYSTPADAPFLFIRGKQLGGRLHTYGRMLLRWSDLDFKAASHDGIGTDWPIGHDELAPYYAEVERFLGLYGRAEGLPTLPDGEFVGRAWMTSSEQRFQERVQGRWPERRVTTWRYMPPNALRIPQPILAAQATGRLTVRPDAQVRRILVDQHGRRATGVEYVDRHTLEVHRVHAKAIMLCASTIESVRLLLNSASDHHPQGLGNGSGMLGRCFMDQLTNLVMGTVPDRFGIEPDLTVPVDPFYGTSGGIYIPRQIMPAGAPFQRGFAFQGTVGRLYSPADRPAKFAFMGFGEMLPSPNNRITLNTRRQDRWGMPIPHIRCVMSEHEKALLQKQAHSLDAMVDAAGLEIEFSGSALGLQEHGRGAFPEADPFSRWLFRRNFTRSMAMGSAIHESGGARMGTDPNDSVLNANNQCWDVPNLFVTDGSCFPTGGCAGTTLTIMALSARASAFVASNIDSL